MSKHVQAGPILKATDRTVIYYGEGDILGARKDVKIRILY